MHNAVQRHSGQRLAPETETSTLRFFQQSHRAGEGDERIVASIFDSLVAAFNEDPDMIGVQASNLALSPGVAMLPLAMDAARLRFRRLIDAELAAERPR